MQMSVELRTQTEQLQCDLTLLKPWLPLHQLGLQVVSLSLHTFSILQLEISLSSPFICTPHVQRTPPVRIARAVCTLPRFCNQLKDGAYPEQDHAESGTIQTQSVKLFLFADKECPIEEGIQTQLQSQDASGNMLAALTALSWIKKKGASFPTRLTKLLLGALSKPKADRLQSGSLQIYTELLPQYKQAQGAMANMLNEVCPLVKEQKGILASKVHNKPALSSEV